MKKTTGFALQFLIFGFLAASLCVFIFYYLYDGQQVYDHYRQVRSIARSLVLRQSLWHTLELFPTIVISIYVLCFSALFTLKPFQVDSFSFSSIAQPAYGVLIFLLALIVSSQLLILPGLAKDSARIEYRLRIAQEMKTRAETLSKQGNYSKTLDVINLFFRIDDTDREMLELYHATIKNIGSSESQSPPMKQAESGEREAPDTYHERGKAAFEAEDYYSALFYLERALALHRNNRELQELYRRAKAKVGRNPGALTSAEVEKKRLIEQKEKGIAFIKNGDYYRAYEIFSSLNKKYPDLKDIALYLEEAVKELEKRDFLPSELREVEWLPSYDNIVFIDSDGYLNTVERTISYMNNFYFYNIRRTQLSGDQPSSTGWKYGKWIDGGIRLKNEEVFADVTDKQRASSFITPYVEPGYLVYIADRKTLLGMLNVHERLSLTPSLRESGLAIESRDRYIAHTLGGIASVYVLTLFLSALAWAKRSIYEFPPPGKLCIFVIVVPFAAHFLRLLYIDMNGLAVYSHRYLARALPAGATVTVVAGIINGVCAVAATLYFLSQSSRVE